MPNFKPAYLIHGDDHGRIAERRARLRKLAESQSGTEGLELFEGDQATPDAAALALDSMTLALGRRFIIVDGVERWKDKELDALGPAVEAIAPDTTVAFFAREDSRNRAPERLHALVQGVGGEISPEASLKPWELPKWVIARAAEQGIELDPDAARALIRHVGDRQQRLLRELEKLALGAGDADGPGEDRDHDGDGDSGGRLILPPEPIQELTAPPAERKAWAVADAIVAGDRRGSVASYLALREHGERLPGLLYWISQRLRVAHDVAVSVERGEPPAQIKRRLRMPSRAADRLIADARRAGADRLRAAICEIADLQLASRGGGRGGAGEDTEALLFIERIAA